jgi:hypothetical protein
MQEMRDIRDATYKGKQQRMVEALTNESIHWVDMNDMDKVRKGVVFVWLDLSLDRRHV